MTQLRHPEAMHRRVAVRIDRQADYLEGQGFFLADSRVSAIGGLAEEADIRNVLLRKGINHGAPTAQWIILDTSNHAPAPHAPKTPLTTTMLAY